MKSIILLLIGTFILISAKCKKDSIDTKNVPLYFRNNSNHLIYIYINDDEQYKAVYSDTLITNFEMRVNGPIKSHTSEMITEGGASWKNIFEVTVPNDTLSLFVIAEDTLHKYSWGTIRSSYLIMQRYDLSLQDLEKRNFEIEYPYDSTRGKMKVYTR